MKRYHSQAGINYLESWPGKDQTRRPRWKKVFRNNFVFSRSTSLRYSDDDNDDGHIYGQNPKMPH